MKDHAQVIYSGLTLIQSLLHDDEAEDFNHIIDLMRRSLNDVAGQLAADDSKYYKESYESSREDFGRLRVEFEKVRLVLFNTQAAKLTKRQNLRILKIAQKHGKIKGIECLRECIGNKDGGLRYAKEYIDELMGQEVTS